MKAVHTIPMLIFVVSLSSAATAQLPFPLPNPSEPDLGKKPQCTKEYTGSIETQITGFEKFRTAGPKFVGQICTLIETGSSWLGGELPDTTRHKLKDMLGFDIDLRFIKAQCRPGESRSRAYDPSWLPAIRTRALQRYNLAAQPPAFGGARSSICARFSLIALARVMSSPIGYSLVR
jgi:hypothetical protein